MMIDIYTIEIEQFKGPFDLLLFFIERDELDIHDIPIASITDDFLAYIRNLEELNIDVASEFILVAATLMRIKARMLIPRKIYDEEGNEVDPREELVQRLIEYKKYKEASDQFAELEASRKKVFRRGNTQKELNKLATSALVDIELETLSLYKLLKAFEQIMFQYNNQQKLRNQHIYHHVYNVEEQRDFVLSKLNNQARISFQDLIEGIQNRIHAIVTFLAILELLNDRKLQLLQGEGVNHFWIKKNPVGRKQ